MKAWTDYPVVELGDHGGVKAPVRECLILSYDGNKYCQVMVGGAEAHIKHCYLYSRPGRCGDVSVVSVRKLESLNSSLRHSHGKPAEKTISYTVYEKDYVLGGRFKSVKTRAEALSVCRHLGNGAEIEKSVFTRNRHGVTSSRLIRLDVYCAAIRRGVDNEN